MHDKEFITDKKGYSLKDYASKYEIPLPHHYMKDSDMD